MKLTRILKVTSDEFYDYIENQVINEVKKNTNKVISASDIERGMKYNVDMDDKHVKVEVIVQEYKRGSVYRYKYKTMTDNIVVGYESEPCEEGLRVTYSQEMDSFNEKKNKVTKSLSTAFYLGRMSDALYGMQDKIINIREGVVEEVKQPVETHKLLRKLITKK